MEYSGNEKLKLKDISFFAANESISNFNLNLMPNSPILNRRKNILIETKDNRLVSFESDLRLLDLTENYSGKIKYNIIYNLDNELNILFWLI